MKKFFYWIGVFFILFGFFGGCEFLSVKLQCPWINRLTKDQVTCLFGLVFVLFGDENPTSRSS